MATATQTLTDMAERPMRLTLHEAVSRKFDKRPDGQIFTRDVKTIYSLMVICLGLQDKPKSKPTIKMGFLSKHYPYTFSVSEAIAVMANLSLNVESSATSTTVSYSIKPDLAQQLLKTFMSAKLLHTPADRTRSEPKEKTMLQPTPKGVSIVQTYCKVNGIKLNDSSASLLNAPFTQCPSIIRTEFNSMDLFLFERSSITGNIIYSEYFVHLLFTRFLGTSPNVWSPNNPSDEIPSLDHRLEMDDEFDFSNFQNHQFTLTAIQNRANQDTTSTELDKKKSGKKSKRESPFAHTFFTNPESDSHVQYYVSDKGVRLYENYKFQGGVLVKYCFSSKSAWQWLMDCTDIMYPSDASNIFSLFYKYGLIEPIILPPSTSTSKKQIPPSKTAFYAPSKKGYDICHWALGNKTPLSVAHGDEIIAGVSGIALSNEAVIPDNQSSSSNEDNKDGKLEESQITIKTVLADPGLRYLFRLHLEHEYCAENLDVYLEIRQFSKKMTILRRVIEAQARGSERAPSKKAVVRLINECLSAAYNIYSSYIAIGATYQLNIDHMLREKITDAVLHNTSPLKSHFGDISRTISIALPESPQKAHIRAEKVPSPIEPRVSIAEPVRSKSPRAMNNKNLSIDIPVLTDDQFKTNTPMTPTKEEMTRSLALLMKLFPLFDEVGTQIRKMLEFDSFPKFLASDTLKGGLRHTSSS